jgi:hypothetical protein
MRIEKGRASFEALPFFGRKSSQRGGRHVVTVLIMLNDVGRRNHSSMSPPVVAFLTIQSALPNGC